MTKQIPITSRAAMIRATAIEGVQIHVLAHWQPQMVGTIRKPSTAQKNGYFFDAPNHAGEIKRMWAGFPKASELGFNPDGSVTYFPNGPKSWTLAFYPPVTMADYLATSAIQQESSDVH